MHPLNITCSHLHHDASCARSLCAMKDMEENSPPKFMSNDLRNGFGIDEAENEATKAALNHKSVTQRRRGENKERSGTYSSATASTGATSALGREQSGKL